MAAGERIRKTPACVQIEVEDKTLADDGAAKLDAGDLIFSDLFIRHGTVIIISNSFLFFTDTSALIYSALKAACKKLVSREKELNDLDTQSGDGDCGSTIALGANGEHIQL